MPTERSIKAVEEGVAIAHVETIVRESTDAAIGSEPTPMMRSERKARLIVMTLFAALFLVVGAGYDTTGVFFIPLLKEFGWSRAQLSLISSALFGFGTVAAPLTGWLLDRIEARIVMVAGAVLAASALVGAGQAHSFAAMLTAYLVLGIATHAGIILPAGFVIANWFTARRGLMMGITMAGSSLGGMVLNMLAGRMLPALGWRDTYLVLAAPIIAILVPLIVVVVESRPSGAAQVSVAESGRALSGLDLHSALRTRSFWMIGVISLCFPIAAAGAAVHLISYLQEIGYSPALSATLYGFVLGCTTLGKLVFGSLCDRIGSRAATAAGMLTFAAGFMAMIAAGHPAFLAAAIPLVGLALGAPLALLPLITAHSLGLKYFGTISGVLSLAGTMGVILGPVTAGRIFDVTRSYEDAFRLFFVLALISGAAAMACRSLESEESHLRVRAARAAA